VDVLGDWFAGTPSSQELQTREKKGEKRFKK
jgi:hypothetical protein